MDDKQIIRLFFERSEQAITELSQKYGDLCMKIARSILNDHQDAEECVNDAYLGAWNSIPPQSPDPLRAYICRIVRNRSLKKLRANTAIKRGSQFEVSLSELEDCIPDNSMDEQLSISELSAQINAFLAALPKDDRLTTCLSGSAEYAGNYINTWIVRRQTYNGSENRQAGVSHRRY